MNFKYGFNFGCDELNSESPKLDCLDVNCIDKKLKLIKMSQQLSFWGNERLMIIRQAGASTWKSSWSILHYPTRKLFAQQSKLNFRRENRLMAFGTNTFQQLTHARFQANFTLDSVLEIRRAYFFRAVSLWLTNIELQPWPSDVSFNRGLWHHLWVFWDFLVWQLAADQNKFLVRRSKIYRKRDFVKCRPKYFF